MKRIGMAILIAALAAAGCSGDNHIAPLIASPTISELLASPDSLVIEGTTMSTAVSLYRDFFPVAPPNGRPLTVFLELNGSPPGTFPDSISKVFVWVIRDSSEVWASRMEFTSVDYTRDGARVYFAGGGPMWDPGTLVDVVLGVAPLGHETSYILIPRRTIGKSE